jgi:hypothetical protein
MKIFRFEGRSWLRVEGFKGLRGLVVEELRRVAPYS